MEQRLMAKADPDDIAKTQNALIKATSDVSPHISVGTTARGPHRPQRVSVASTKGCRQSDERRTHLSSGCVCLDDAEGRLAG